MHFENIIIRREGSVAILQLNRPKVLNALNAVMMTELCEALENLDRDETIRCLILIGDEKAFAAGADIRELVEAGPIEMMQKNTVGLWTRVQAIPNPSLPPLAGMRWEGDANWPLRVTSSRFRRRSIRTAGN